MTSVLKPLLAGFLFLLCLGGLCAQTEDEFDVQQNSDGTLTITRFKMTYHTFRADIVIPSRLHGIDVTVIGEGAFQGVWGSENSRIRTVVLPEKLKKIGSAAFSSNSIGAIVFPETLEEIGGSAFYGNALSEAIVFPETLEEIGKGAFYGNALSEVHFPPKIKTISGVAFAGNAIRHLVIPNGITSIDREAFSSNPIYSLTIPASVVSIDYMAFAESDIKKIEIRGSAGKRINSDAFGFEELENLQAVSIDANVQWSTRPFGEGFSNYYNSQGRKAGIYIKKGPIWTLGTQADFDKI